VTRSLYLKELYVPEGVLRTGIDKWFRRRPRHRHRRDARSPRASASNSAGTPRATLAIKSTGPPTGFQFGNGPSQSHAVYEGRVDPGELIDHQRTPPPMGVSGAEPETVVRSQPIPLGEPGSGTGGTTKSGPASTAGTPAGAMTSRAGMFGHRRAESFRCRPKRRPYTRYTVVSCMCMTPAKPLVRREKRVTSAGAPCNIERPRLHARTSTVT
jgi:hypothetical protein